MSILKPRVVVLWNQDFPSLVLANHLEKQGFDVQPVRRLKDALALGPNPMFLYLVDDAFLIPFVEAMGRDVAIVAIVSSESKNLNQALELGVRDLITKPVDLNVAEARVKIQCQLLLTTQELQVTEDRYALALEGTSDGIWDWDIDEGTVIYSQRWKAMLGFRDDEIGNALEDWLDRIHTEDSERVQNALESCLQGGLLFAEEYRLQHKDGSFRWFLSRGMVHRAKNGGTRMVGAQTDLTYRGVHDDLTGLPKRALFLESLQHAIGRSRSPDSNLAVLEITITKFTNITTTYGDYIGDQVLLKFVEIVRKELGPGHYFARVDGPTFVCFMDDISHEEFAIQFAKNLLQKTQQAIHIFDQRIRVQIAIGISLYEAQNLSPENLLRNAHAALIHAMGHPHGGWKMFEPQMRASVEEHLELENNLRVALQKSELSLCYQPQVNRDGELTGMEALLRWDSERMGPIEPVKFIPAAETSGDIVPIGFWVLEEAVKQWRKWTQKGLPEIRLAVNFSGHQLKVPNLIEKVVSILDGERFDPRNLDLELTESLLVDPSQEILDILGKMNDLGIRLEIDDFGTGYSSLGYLAQFPFNALKVDRTFVKDLPNTRSHALCNAVIQMGKALGLQIKAEGVEKVEQVDVLHEMGCDLFQGFYFSKPLPMRTALRKLKKMAKPQAKQKRC